jgi:two-component sensor histidine kinase
LVRNEWQHFVDLVGSGIAVHGSPVRLNPAATEAIGLALYELATNAGKYGALSAGVGRVDVDWGFDS